MNKLEVIYKITERCNINCSYCYMFNGADRSFRDRPARVSGADVALVARYLRAGALELGLTQVQVDLHGGEPLLLGKRQFEHACQTLVDALKDVTNVRLCLQTNATTIDREWVDIFARYDIRVGVSMDGPADYHDVARRDFRDRGTYSATVAGLGLLQDAANAGRIAPVGLLCVINPKSSAVRIVDHFVNVLGVRTMDFLLPDDTHDTFRGDPEEFGRFLCQLFDFWAEADDPSIQIRILNSVLSIMVGGRSLLSGLGLGSANAITIESDGAVGSDDILRSCGVDWLHRGATVEAGSLKGFVESEQMRELSRMRDEPSETCTECCWYRVCGGGAMTNRFSRTGHFRNPSVFCTALQMLYARVGRHLIDDGYDVNLLTRTLLPTLELAPA